MKDHYALTVINKEELPKVILNKFIGKGKFIDAVGYSENNAAGKTYWIKEGYELYGYFINSDDGTAILAAKLPLTWLPHLMELPVVVSVIEAELFAHKERKGLVKPFEIL